MAYYSAATADVDDSAVNIPRSYAWVVFALTFGLLISDYMSRQVLNAVFPLLKSEWMLSDSQLGLLSGIVALMVGLLTFPLSLLADRWGRVRSLVLMATLWSLATLGCSLAEGYSQMFLARFFVGVGEAAYGSVGIAVVISVFPKHMRATLTGAFMAGGMFGSVLGMALGGVLAEHLGWRWSFAGMAMFGLLLAMVYPLVVKQSRIGASRLPQPTNNDEFPCRRPLKTLFASRSVVCAYIGSGLQLFVGAAVMVWFPSYLNRYYHMDTDQAGAVAAIIVLTGGAGMIFCGILSDRLCRNAPERKIALAIAYCLISCLLLSVGFQMAPGVPQLVVIAMAMLVATGTSGPAGAMVANLTHYSIHGTAFATLTLANNMLGLAPGPYLTGVLADHFGLDRAFQLIPLISVAAALVFLYGKRHYRNDIQKLSPLMTTEVRP
ncbi:MFS transporter [Pseudomonas sp. LFM046]|uniref:MFS transporter n=1 Tax=Pseudomonas sp. LFM046 TaxID=1608357 RepID=UPI0005CF950B|nr:MFS transporter [Pseudomonas sp. LFM046]